MGSPFELGPLFDVERDVFEVSLKLLLLFLLLDLPLLLVLVSVPALPLA